MSNGKHPGGRPTAYEEEFSARAEALCRDFALTDRGLAQVFNVSKTTITNWKNEHPKFLASIKNGKSQKDRRVERSLYERATGYSHPEEKVFCQQGEIVTHETRKHYPPDTAAAFIWLKNRQPERWRDKIEIQASGNINITWDDPTAIDVSPGQIEDVKELEGAKDAQLSDK